MKTSLTAALGVLAAFSWVASSAQGVDGDDEEPVRCINLRSIDRTEILDDQNILFYMYGGKIYLNRLSHPATGLDRHQPFMYRTNVSNLCKGEIITVLEDWGFGFTPGASTTLGKFAPIDAAAANDLRRGQRVEVQEEPVAPK